MNIHRKTVHLSGDSVNMGFQLRTSELFRLFQETAGDHSAELGLPQSGLMERGLTWVLALQTVEISKLPRYQDKVVIETWPGPFKHILCPRFFQVRILPEGAGDRPRCSADNGPRRSVNGGPACGEVVIRSSSVWSILDMEKRIAINPAAEGLTGGIDNWELDESALDDATRETAAMKRPRALRFGPLDRRMEITVPFSTVDYNGHMNNTRYFDLAEDILFREGLLAAKNAGTTFVPPELAKIEMEYRAELLAGETIPVLWGEEGDVFCLQGGDPNPAFRMRLTYR